MMVYVPSPHFLLSLFRILLNTFIPSAGGHPLLAQAHAIWRNEPTHSNNVLLVVPIILQIFMSGLVSHEIEKSHNKGILIDFRSGILLDMSCCLF